MNSKSNNKLPFAIWIILFSIIVIVLPIVELKYLMTYLEESIDPAVIVDRFPFLENETWFAVTVYPSVAFIIFFIYWVHIKFVQRLADMLDSIIEKNGKSQIS